MGKRFTEEEKETIWSMRETGVPVKRIAKHLGRQNSSLRMFIADAGGRRPPKRVRSVLRLSLEVASAVMNAQHGEKDMNSRSVARDAVSIELGVAATLNGRPSSLAFSKAFEDAAVFCDGCHDEWSAADAALQAARGQLTLKHELQAKHRR